MKGLYNFSLSLTTTLIKVFSGFSPRLKILVRGRKTSFASLAGFAKDNPKRKAWFHVASLGEYEQAKPVIHEFKSQFPDWGVVVTFFSPSGYEHVSKRAQSNVDFIAYLPFDTAGNAREWVGLLNPEVVFFVKYDLWANFIFRIKENNIPLFLFSAAFRPDQIYFKKYGSFFRELLFAFDHIFTQNIESVELLKGIQYHEATLTGDTRYDNVQAISQKPQQFIDIAAFVQDRHVIVVGSAWEEDMALIIPLINTNSNYKYIIAPHDINIEKIKDWQNRITVSSVTYSTMNETSFHQKEVLFIDNIGMLSSLYQYAKIAYVGGAFGKGLHNILEPIAFNIPVAFGKVKRAGKFPEAAISQEYGCGFSISSSGELDQFIRQMEDSEKYQKACYAAKKLVSDNLGSAKRIIKHVQHMVQ